MLIILALIILFHLASAILLLVATIHSVSTSQEWGSHTSGEFLLSFTVCPWLFAGVVGGVTKGTRGDLH